MAPHRQALGPNRQCAGRQSQKTLDPCQLRWIVREDGRQTSGNQSSDTGLAEGPINGNEAVNFLLGVDVVSTRYPAKSTVEVRGETNLLTKLLILLVIASANKPNRQEVGVDAVLELIL